MSEATVTADSSEESGMLSCAQAANEIYLDALAEGKTSIDAMRHALRCVEEGMREAEEAPVEIQEARKFDAASRLLLTAAEIVQEQHAYSYEEKAAGGNMHPIRALYIADGGCKSDEYETAVRRLFDCCRVDFMDHDQVENIDDLVAAAFWEIESDQAKRRAA